MEFLAVKLLVFMLICICISSAEYNGVHREAYIVYMGDLGAKTTSLMDHHHSLLTVAIGDEITARESLIYSYTRSFNGFAAMLLPHEAEILSNREGVVSVFKNQMKKLLTTRSWDFLGMPLNVKRNKQIESDIIVAMLDTGILSNSPSCNDDGFGPPPAKWKGVCEKGVNFTGCNNKVIGARNFDLLNKTGPEDKTPVDLEGHGTHTASTVAGVAVKGASLYGIAKGTARGGVPSARIASYKVCHPLGCSDADILAAFDAAIVDGADVISVSIGGSSPPFMQDSIAIGSFHAAKYGVLTVCSAGNDGPDLKTVENVAPWIFTVSATTSDRTLITEIDLGNGRKVQGSGLNTFVPKTKFYPLINGFEAVISPNSSANASMCIDGTMDKKKVQGKIIYCRGALYDPVPGLQRLGAAGVIQSDEFFSLTTEPAFPILIPGATVNLSDGWMIDRYINDTKSATVIVHQTKTAPLSGAFVGLFSSRGPQDQVRHILKPDIAAPGVNILAAYSTFATFTGDDKQFDKRFVKYSIISGTSMSCPHVSGAAAYVKTFHPRWSPAAIKSALMTTARQLRNKVEEGELATGSGLIDPTRALNPGLVYNMDMNSYISFLCKENFTDTQIALLMGSKRHNCSTVPKALGKDGLNYPTFHMQVMNTSLTSVGAVFYRVVTNVGDPKSSYRAHVKAGTGLSIQVTPDVLSFTREYQKKRFKVTVIGKFEKGAWKLRGSLSWRRVDGKGHDVRSPVFIYRHLPSIMFSPESV